MSDETEVIINVQATVTKGEGDTFDVALARVVVNDETADVTLYSIVKLQSLTPADVFTSTGVITDSPEVTAATLDETRNFLRDKLSDPDNTDRENDLLLDIYSRIGFVKPDEPDEESTDA